LAFKLGIEMVKKERKTLKSQKGIPFQVQELLFIPTK